MAQFPGLLLWTDAWIADTIHLSRKERGIYIDLLVLMWRTPGCRVPNDNDWLAKHMLMTAKEVSTELQPIIEEFCQVVGNYLCQKRLQKEFVRAFQRSEKQAARAKRRWEKEKGSCRGNAAHAMQPTQISKKESFFSRAREDEETEEAADKKRPAEISAELVQLMNKRLRAKSDNKLEPLPERSNADRSNFKTTSQDDPENPQNTVDEIVEQIHHRAKA
jgi:uncharacterized protein YdaU (DUF1376 family)